MTTGLRRKKGVEKFTRCTVLISLKPCKNLSVRGGGKKSLKMFLKIFHHQTLIQRALLEKHQRIAKNRCLLSKGGVAKNHAV